MDVVDGTISQIAQWLDAVDVATAAARVAEAQARHLTKGEPGAACIAKHEAAHAVVAHRSGLRVGYARMLADGSGCVAYEAEPTSPAAMIARVAADLASVASELIEGAHPWRRPQLASSNDVLLARLNVDVCRSLVPEWRLSYRCFAMISCVAVWSNWALIDNVARALRTAGQLNGARIAALCFGALRGIDQ